MREMFRVRGCVGTTTAQQLRAFFSHVLAGEDSIGQGSLLLGGHLGHRAHQSIAVAKLILMPGNELYKFVIESNAN